MIIQTNADIIANSIEALPGILGNELKTGLDNYLNDFLTRFKANQLSGRPGLNTISGRLRNSFDIQIDGEKLDIYADLGTDVDYAIYHELGTKHIPARLRFFDSFIEDYELLDDYLDQALETALDQIQNL